MIDFNLDQQGVWPVSLMAYSLYSLMVACSLYNLMVAFSL